MRMSIAERLQQRKGQSKQPKEYDVSYFSLREDGETARIRFLADTIEDIDWHIVHVIQFGNRWLDFKCNGEGCALCEAGEKPVDKLYIQLQHFTEDGVEHKVWTRTLTKDFGNKLVGLSERYEPLSGKYFDVERSGEPYSNASYNFFVEGDCDEEIPEKADISGMIRERSNADMEEYLRTGDFPNPYANKQEPAAKPAPRPAAKPAPRPAAKPAPRPAAKPAPRPAAKPAPRPAAKPAPRPAAEELSQEAAVETTSPGKKPSLRDRARKHGF